ncbi:MAG: MiaB/RimO family radical SAM methylthiotransferase [Lachnospiraceae bacterium]|nr:MiaB/RimO family radical SAM methylthiotransferase [Lachnospiraceae bacterium]
MKTIAFHNLGCKVNSYELDVMQQIMREKGYKIVPFDQMADIYVINTCTVTNIADRKSRQMLHRAKQKNPNAVVVAVGCYVQTDLAGAVKDPAIDLAIGNNRKKDIAEILEQYLAEHDDNSLWENEDRPRGVCEEDGIDAKPISLKKENDAREDSGAGFEDKTLGGTTILDIAHEKEYEEMQLKTTAEHTRAYIKIQDGCNQFCSYCAIPLARGRVRSRKPEDVLREVEGIVAAGYQEIVLTGIHVSSYGIDFKTRSSSSSEKQKDGLAAPGNASVASSHGVAASKGESPAVNAGEAEKDMVARDYRGETQLFDLIERIHEVPGLQRIRISSLEPRIVTPESARRLAALPKVCPHFHLSLQSGCDATLKRMNRHYTAQQYLESVQALRAAYAPRVPAITTDVIVGFPGETEEEFAITKAFLETVGFYDMHVFKYSKRAGTRAAVMEGQIPDPIKASRSDVLLELEREQSIAFRKQKLGQVVAVLMEEEKEIGGKNYLLGHTTDYVRVALALNSDDMVAKCVDEQKTSKQASGLIATRAGEILQLKVTEFLTEEILLGQETNLF